MKSIDRKFSSMDDEVWAKIIIFEKNTQVAKAYIKTPVLTIDGSNVGFNGHKVGINGFEMAKSDKESSMCKLLIEEGCRIKLTQNGDVLIKRDDSVNIFTNKPKKSQSSVSDIIMKLPYGLLQQNKTYKLFDMKKFQENLSQELLTENPKWDQLQNQVDS